MDLYYGYDDYEREITSQRTLVVHQWLCDIKSADKLPDNTLVEKASKEIFISFV